MTDGAQDEILLDYLDTIFRLTWNKNFAKAQHKLEFIFSLRKKLFLILFIQLLIYLFLI